METLIINIPDKKSDLVKQILKELGVTIKSEILKKKKASDYAGSISKKAAQQILTDIGQSKKEWERNI